MKSYETRSLIYDNPKLLDLPDAELAAGDISDICESLHYNLRELDTCADHPNGKVELFESKFSGVHLKGRILRTNEEFNCDIALAASYSNKGIMRAVSVCEYSDGAKYVFANRNLQMLPSIRQNFLFLETPTGNYSAAESFALENIGSVISAEVNIKDDGDFELTNRDFASFTLYSLYKLNGYMGVLRGDTNVA